MSLWSGSIQATFKSLLSVEYAIDNTGEQFEKKKCSAELDFYAA